MTISNSAGISLPPEVDVAIFDSINQLIARIANPNAPANSSKKTIWHAFASAWNGVAFRCRAASEYDAEFQKLILMTTWPGGDVRYKQEVALFGCVNSALSSFECFCVASYAAAASLSVPSFPLTSDAHLRIMPRDVSDAFRKGYPNEKFTLILFDTIQSENYNALKDLRNALSHRGILPRRHFLSNHAVRPSAVPSNPKSMAENHAYDSVLGVQTTATPVKWLHASIGPLTAELGALLERNAPPV
jgi:hypothetical protein